MGIFCRHVQKIVRLCRRDAGHDMCAVINGELRVLGAKAAGDALDENLGMGGRKWTC